jgi:hypothetical protein
MLPLLVLFRATPNEDLLEWFGTGMCLKRFKNEAGKNETFQDQLQKCSFERLQPLYHK